MRQHYRFLKYLVTRFFDDLVLTRAGALAFTTLLSLVPLAILIFYLLSFFPTLSHAATKLEYFIVDNFVPNSAARITHALDAFLTNVHILSWWNIVALTLFSILLIYEIVDAINGVWRVKHVRRSMASFMIYGGVLIFIPFACAAVMMLVSEAMSLPILAKAGAFRWLSYLFSCGLEWVIFAFFHWAVPSCRVYWRFAVLTGLLTTLLFELAKWGFVAYIHHVSTYQVVYGALAAIPLFFLWIYVAWVVVVSSALICHAFQEMYLKE